MVCGVNCKLACHSLATALYFRPCSARAHARACVAKLRCATTVLCMFRQLPLTLLLPWAQSFLTITPNKFGAWGPVFAFLCVCVNLGGIYWAYGLWAGYRKFKAKQELSRFSSKQH